jgi:hypothetical protein
MYICSIRLQTQHLDLQMDGRLVKVGLKTQSFPFHFINFT